MKKNSLACSVSLLLFFPVYSQQDPQFTQYMYNTSNINPAYAGSREVLSVFGMYRTQWIGLDGAPNTGVFSIDTPVSERVGLGLSFYNDQISISDQSVISTDFSYTIPVFLGSKSYNLAFGLKATAHLLSINYGKLNIKDPDPVFNASNNLNNQFSPNIGTGVYFYSDKFYTGISVPNILETEHYDDNVQSKASERMHGYLITGYVFELPEDIKFKPAALIKMVEGAPLQTDLTANFLYKEKFVLGLAWRWNSAISTLAGFQYNKSWFIGYAYDAETTRLSRYNSGSHEVFLRYEFEFSSDDKRIISPRFF